MSDSFRRLWEDQERLRRLADPFGDLRRQAVAFQQLGVGSTTLEFLRQEEERRRLLAGFTMPDVGEAASLASEFERQRKLVEGPIEEARRSGLLDPGSDIRKSLASVMDARASYEGLFRLPGSDETGRLATEAMSASRIAREFLAEPNSLRDAMGQVRAPWVSIEDEVRSARAFADIMGIGRALQTANPFSGASSTR